MKIAIVAVGTEITSGEVVNSNAAWLATELEVLGFQVTHHMAVPDDDLAMVEAFDFLSSKVDLIVTTGGLGPTTDDKTARVISEWLDKKFVFEESVWVDLQKLHKERGLKIRDGHKTQCWFPTDAQLFPNPVGSAQGFYSKNESKKVLALPGPPSEIQGLWEKDVKQYLSELPTSKKLILKKWTCLGVTESELAEKIEKLFEGSGIELGYRASVPYVQVKAWFEDEEALSQWNPKALKVMEPWLVSQDGIDPIKNWSEQLPLGEIAVFDSMTEGYLVSRLWETGTVESIHEYSSAEFDRTQKPSEKTVFFIEINATGFEVEAGVWSPSVQKWELIKFPYKLNLRSKRAQKYFTEMAFQTWAGLLKD